ncbi:MAG TPA: AMP-binding protein [Burkholderiales bacterium]|nr:AMP-binding protein [Burkholderiales bacterium]
MRVERFLWDAARRAPEKTAIVCGEERPTYAELAARAAGLARELQCRGVRRGDRVVVFLHNSPAVVVAVFGVLAAGAVFSVVNPGTKTDKLAYILNNARAAALITEPRLAGTAREAAARAPSVKSLLTTPLEFSDDRRPEGGIDLDLAMIVYTSGSTGFPKGVMMTHANVVAAATSITAYLESRADDTVLSVLPMAFDYGLYQALMCARVGATLVLERSFAYPALVLERLQRERVTGFPLVPTLAAMLLQMKELQPGMFPHLRYLTNTAAALPKAHILRLRELFPGAKLYSMYGVTECKRCTYLPPDQLTVRPDSVGIAIPGTEAYVVDESGERAPPGVVGELVIRGAHVMKGYWENEEATRQALRAGPYPWEKVLYTGDLFRCDEEGYLYFVARKDDIIKTRGEKVSPREVENCLYELPGVREAVVVGVPDPLLGAAVKAVLVIDPGSALTPREVIRHCAARLEEFMVPKHVEFRAELPRSENGKVARRELAAEALA